MSHSLTTTPNHSRANFLCARRACEKTNRVSYNMELDPKYCDVIIKRWQEFTGKQAINEGTGKPYIEMGNVIEGAA